jgi:hypothetical protein
LILSQDGLRVRFFLEHQRKNGHQDHEADDGKDYGYSYLIGMHGRSRLPALVGRRLFLLSAAEYFSKIAFFTLHSEPVGSAEGAGSSALDVA